MILLLFCLKSFRITSSLRKLVSLVGVNKEENRYEPNRPRTRPHWKKAKIVIDMFPALKVNLRSDP